jgi:hypothetical protein
MSFTRVINRAAIIAATLAFAFATTTRAQSAGEDKSSLAIAGETLPAESIRESRFPILDVDGDGYIRREEVRNDDPVLKSQFDSLDWDNDGKLSEAEYVLNGRPQ